MKSLAVSKFVFFLLLVTLTSCTKSSSRRRLSVEDRTIHVQAGDLGHKPWDIAASAGVVWNFNAAVFTPILSFDERFELTPGIIKNWNWDSKTNSYELTVDRGLYFYKGRQVSARDIEFTLIKPFLANDYSQAQEILRSVKGMSKLKPGQKFKPDMVEGLKVEGDGRLRLTLVKPNPVFLYSLGLAMPPVGPIEAFKKDLVSFKKWPIGTGDYEVVESAPELNYVLLMRKNFDEEKKKNERYPLIIKFFLTGDAVQNRLDLATGTVSYGLENNSNYTSFYSKIIRSIQVIDFNYNNKLGANLLFRKAVSLAIDRKKILKKYSNGAFGETHELVPSAYYGRTNKKYEHDKSKAKDLIRKHFGGASSEKKPLLATYHGILNEPLPKYVKSIQEQLKEVGLYIKFVGVSSCIFKDSDTKFVMTTYGNPTNYVDPLLPFSPYLGRGDRRRHGDKGDKEAHRLFDLALNAPTKEERARFISMLAEHFSKNFRMIPYRENKSIFAYSKRIEGVDHKKINYTFDFGKVKVRRLRD